MFGSSKSHVLALAVGLSTLFSSAALAQAAAAPASAPSAAGPTKVGIVSIQDAILATNEGKKETEALNQRFSPKQAELKTLNDEVENLKKQLQAQGDKLSEEEKNTRVRTLEVKQKNLQRSFEDAQNEYQQASQEMVNRIGSKMLTVLEKYAKANGYSVILDVSNPQTPVLWASQGSNITKELVDAFNAESPVSAPAAPKATTTNKPAAPAPRPAATPKKP
jgi:Skp family chaperone for outer membrane proteins